MSNDGGFMFEMDGSIARLKLNRAGKRNAISRRMWAELATVLGKVGSDPKVRLVQIDSVDPTIFSAGGDIGEFNEIYASPESAMAFAELYGKAMRLLTELQKPTLAVIRGACVGAGCSIATACDLRIADTTARFAVTPARLGIVYNLSDTCRLVNLVGTAKAKDMIYTGRMVEAREAHDIGLIDHLHPPQEIEDSVVRFSEQITTSSQYTIVAAKRIIAEVLKGAVADTPFTAGIAEKAYVAPDFAEGVAAFREKRTPRFTFGFGDPLPKQ